MIRPRLLATAFMLTSSVALVAPAANAQTTNPYLNGLIQQSNQMIGDTNDLVENEIKPAADRYQNYLQSLSTRCYNGDTAACNEYSQRMERQMRHMENLDRQWNIKYGPGSGWAESFGY